MFEAAVTKFSKIVGDERVFPTPTIDQNTHCMPLYLVVKKNRKWRWQSPVYEPTPFKLTQILKEQDEMLTQMKEMALIYNKVHKLSVKGKIGAKIKTLLDMELDGSDTVDVEANFGSINRICIDETKLMDCLSTRHLNVDHDFVKQVREHPRKVLCIVVSSYLLDSQGTIIAKKDISGEEKLGDEKLAKTVADAEEDAIVEDDNSNTVTLPANTVLAYRVCELFVRSDKTLELIIDKDSNGGFQTMDEVDSCSTSSLQHTSVIEQSVDTMFADLVKMESSQKEPLVKAVLQICNYPRDVDTFLVLTKKALALAKETAGGLGITKDTHLCILKEKFICPDQDWAPLLQMAGFSFIDDGTVIYPNGSYATLESIVNVFRSLIELDDEQLMAFSQVTSEVARPLIYLLSQTLRKRSLISDDKDLALLYTGENTGQLLLATLGFGLTSSGEVVAPANKEHELQGASRALFALFWQKDYDVNTSHWCHLL